MKSTEWWRQTAQHMWRSYFVLKKKQEDGSFGKDMTYAEQNTYEMCDKVFSEKFVRPDQEILTMYFTSRWGDDLYAVEDYSLKHNIPTKVIWIVIRRANRLVMEEAGLLDRKEED